MSPRNKVVGKVVRVEASRSSHQIEELDIVGVTYDDTYRLIENYGETLKWG
jgi:hypothetical protein